MNCLRSAIAGSVPARAQFRLHTVEATRCRRPIPISRRMRSNGRRYQLSQRSDQDEPRCTAAAICKSELGCWGPTKLSRAENLSGCYECARLRVDGATGTPMRATVVGHHSLRPNAGRLVGRSDRFPQRRHHLRCVLTHIDDTTCVATHARHCVKLPHIQEVGLRPLAALPPQSRRPTWPSDQATPRAHGWLYAAKPAAKPRAGPRD